MKQKIYGAAVFFCILGLAACDQEPLFWDIAHEYPPIEPIIGGAPSPIVKAFTSTSGGTKEVLYTANGSVWEYDLYSTNAAGKPWWAKMAFQPGGKIKTVAAAGDPSGDKYLFSLDWNGAVQKWDGTSWTPVSLPVGGAEQIYGAGDYLFAGCRTGSTGSLDGYSIVSIDTGTNTATKIQQGTALLSGAAFNSGSYFLSTRGKGVYITSSPGSALSPPDTSAGDTVLGLLYHDSTDPAKKGVYAVSSGNMWFYGGSGFVSKAGGYEFTGGISSWINGGNEFLLLALSRSNGNFGYGYREFNLAAGVMQTPGASTLSSVETGSQYTSAIGDHAVNWLYVVNLSPYTADSGGRPVIFASTVKNGLWSYRMRGGRAQWNGEDNSD